MIKNTTSYDRRQQNRIKKLLQENKSLLEQNEKLKCSLSDVMGKLAEASFQIMGVVDVSDINKHSALLIHHTDA
jgi:hypothetical protein